MFGEQVYIEKSFFDFEFAQINCKFGDNHKIVLTFLIDNTSI